MHQITLFQDKKSKNFLGRGHGPLPRPHPSGEAHAPPPSTPTAPRSSRLRRSIPAPPFRKSWIRHCRPARVGLLYGVMYLCSPEHEHTAIIAATVPLQLQPCGASAGINNNTGHTPADGRLCLLIHAEVQNTCYSRLTYVNDTAAYLGSRFVNIVH